MARLLLPYHSMGTQHCLLIADDLTGGADAGVQFAKRGLKTLLLPFHGEGFALCQADAAEVLVVNTITRSLTPTEAFAVLSDLMKQLSHTDFQIIYKKIDSTLRGNIGSEMDAILKQTNLPLAFLAPSYPEQGRTLVGGIMLVNEKPLALTETGRDAASPVEESHVCKLLAAQTTMPIGTIDLTHVASGKAVLKRMVEEQRQAGRRIIIFDAVTRQDLATIAEVALSMEIVPLLVGSAGLAGEIARIRVPGTVTVNRNWGDSFRHIMIVGGSASTVTHEQLRRLEEKGFPSFELTRKIVNGNGSMGTEDRLRLVRQLGSALSAGNVILRTFTERWTDNEGGQLTIPRRIAGAMADVTCEALQEARVNTGDLALCLTGGDTALEVLNVLRADQMEIRGEIIEGIVIARLMGGLWNGLTIVTKAGAFGKEDALERVIETLVTSSSTKGFNAPCHPSEAGRYR